MGEHEGDSKKKQEEPFIILGGSEEKKHEAEHKQAEHEPAKEHTKKQEKGDYVIDFSGALNIFGETKLHTFKKVSVYILLLIILLLVAQARLLPINEFPKDAPLSSADPWWQYRHSKEIAEHGFPGTDIKIVDGKKVYWDYLHDAPEGGSAPVEFYQYFAGYSYKYIGKSFFPNLADYMRFTPVLFGVLATLTIFFLAREIFGEKSGLLAAFIFGLSGPYLQRSVVGHADTDAIIGFFTILTVFLFFKAWKKKSFLWAGFAGISLGLFGFTWPGGYTATAIILILGAVIYYILRFLEITIKQGPLAGIKWYYLAVLSLAVFAEFILFMKFGLAKILLYGAASIFAISTVIPLLLVLLKKDINLVKQIFKEEWRGFAVLAIFLIIGLGMVAIIISPWHANLLRSFEGFLTLRATQRAPQVGGDVIRNVFLTVAEFNQAPPRIIVFSTHMGAFLLAALSIFSIPLWFYKNLKEDKSHFVYYIVPFLLLWAAATYYASLNAIRFIEAFAIPVAIIGSSVIGLGSYLEVLNTKKNTRTIVTVALVLLVIFTLFMVPNISPYKGEQQIGAPYVQNAFGIAARSGGGEGANWLQFFKWARESTPKGAIFASWWDPGHAFTALAERPTVADGSQNHNHVHDLALMFTLNNSGDVNLALNLMKKYNITYFYTTTDLLGKYGAISFLGTGTAENYQQLTADQNQIAQSSTGDLLISYPFDLQTERGRVPSVVLFNLKGNGTGADAAWKIADTAPRKISKIYYYTPDGKLQSAENKNTNETVDVMLVVLPGYGNAFFLQTYVGENLLTRLHLFDGQGLENYFEKVKDFNGEIKVFRVKYENFKE